MEKVHKHTVTAAWFSSFDHDCAQTSPLIKRPNLDTQSWFIRNKFEKKWKKERKINIFSSWFTFYVWIFPPYMFIGYLFHRLDFINDWIWALPFKTELKFRSVIEMKLSWFINQWSRQKLGVFSGLILLFNVKSAWF